MTARKKTQYVGSVSLGKMLSTTTTCSVDRGEEVIELVFKRNFWTSAVEAYYFDGKGRFSEKNNRLVADNVVSWNITDGDKMLPITTENLQLLDAYLVEAMVDAMIATVNPKKKSSQA